MDGPVSITMPNLSPPHPSHTRAARGPRPNGNVDAARHVGVWAIGASVPNGDRSIVVIPKWPPTVHRIMIVWGAHCALNTACVHNVHVDQYHQPGGFHIRNNLGCSLDTPSGAT